MGALELLLGRVTRPVLGCQGDYRALCRQHVDAQKKCSRGEETGSHAKKGGSLHLGERERERGLCESWSRM